jgi:drug/metabolite transporter (DMT)-like permease
VPLLPIFLVALSSIGFGGWPIGARAANTTPAWTNVILMVTTAVLMIGYNGKALLHEPITGKQVVVMVGVAALNSAALIGFGVLIQKYPQYIPIAQALMPVVTVVGSWLILGETLCARQIVGIVVVAVGVYLIRPTSS